MSDTIRAFIAVELPEDVKAELAKLIERLRRSGARGLRLVRVEGIHLTLKFLGNVPQARVEPITDALRHAAERHSPFKARLGDVGVFPDRRNPRVLWVGLQGDLEPLKALQGDVEEALARMGFARESLAFSPHLTLARLQDGASPTDRRTAAEALFLAEFKTGLEINVESANLIRSILKPGGAVYETLASVPLKSVSDKESG